MDGGDKIYEGEGGFVHVEVNSKIEFAIAKSSLYVEDDQGKAHKLYVVKTTRKSN